MNNITIYILLINVVLIFVLPRRFVLIPILVSGIILGMGQRIDVMNLNFTPVRILLLCGWIRLIIKSEYRLLNKLNSIDKVFLLYIFWITLAYTLREYTIAAFIYRLNVVSYTLGTYFLVRCYIIELDDIELNIKALLYLSIVIAIFVAIERTTQNNYFSVFGNVDSYTYLREGKVRCFGSFSHPITSGSFGAFLTSLAFYVLWKKNGNRILGLASLTASVVIVVASSSSGPAISLMATMMGLFIWRLRKYLRLILWGFFFSLIGLHIVMKGPVWALINHVGVFIASSTYHRFLIIDQLIKNFNEWWLIGVNSTGQWDVYAQVADVSNNYARVAVDGGFLALALFITIIVFCFRHIGKMIILAHDNLDHQKLFWIWGVGMFSYVVSFIGVSLWDQTIVIWYFIIATIASIKYNNNKSLQNEEQTSEVLTP